MPTVDWDEIDPKKFFVVCPTLFLGVRALLYPSTLIKTRLQVQKSSGEYRGTFHAFQTITKQSGYRSLYKGFAVNSLGIISGNVYITTYELARYNLMQKGFNQVQGNLFGGICASLVGQTIVVPLDVVSQKLMVDRTNTKSAAGITRSIISKEGVLGLYRGYFTSVATYAPSSAIWWGMYALLNDPIYDKLPPQIFKGVSREVCAQACAGSASGVVAAILTNPMDVIRTRQQVGGHASARETFRSLIKVDGFRALGAGVTARVLQMASSGLLMVVTYEAVKRLSRRTDVPSTNAGGETTQQQALLMTPSTRS